MPEPIILYGANNRPIPKGPPAFNDPAHWTIVGSGSPWGDNPPKDYGKLLDAYTSWVEICVSKISMSLAMAPLYLYRDMGGGDLGDPIERHVVYDLFRKPNPRTRQVRMQFFQKTWIHLELTGNAYWYAPGVVAGRPRELYILRPDRVKAVTRGAGDFVEVLGYRYNAGSGVEEVMLPVEEVVHFKYPHPKDPVYGLSRLSTQEYPYDIDHALGVHEYSFFKNRAVVDLILSVKGVTQDQGEAIVEKYKQKHQGPDKAFEPMVIPGEDVKVESLTQSAKDAQVAELADRVRDKLLSSFDMPAGKVGLIEDVNRANGDFLDAIFARESLIPRGRMFCETLDAQFLPRFDDRLVCALDIDVPGDKEFEQKRDVEDVQNGIRTINQVREDRGDQPVEWGDTWYKPFNLMPVGEDPDLGESRGEDSTRGATSAVTKDARQESIWKQFVARTDPQERTLKRGLVKFFQRQERETIERLAEYGPKTLGVFEGWSKGKVKAHLTKNMDLVDQILGDMTGYTDEMQELLRLHEYEAFREHGEAALAELGALEIDFSLQEVQGLAWIDEKVATSARIVNEGTFRVLGDTLSEGLVAGEGIPELTARVQTVFADSWRGTEASSRRIARTEIIGAANKGAMEGYKAGGATSKEWIAEIDDRVREEHAAANGQIVPIHLGFSVAGEALAHPGDPSGSPENIINCRCTVAPVLD